MPQLSDRPWLFDPNYLWWGVQIMRRLIMQFPPVSFYFHPIMTKYSHTSSAYVPSLKWQTKFYTHIKQHAKL